MPGSFDFLNLVSLNMLPFLMVVTRLGTILFIIPPFRSNNIPNLIKVLITLAITIIIFPLVSIDIDIIQLSYFEIFNYIITELLVGITIGFIISVIFTAVQFAGSLIDFNSGFGFSNVIDPLTQENITITSKFYLLIATTLFFTINGQSLVIGAVVESYDILPLGVFKLNIESIGFLLRLFANIFSIGFKIAAPLTVTLFLTEVALAVLARAIPQMNVFIIGFSLKISVLFILLAVTLINTVPYMQSLFEDSFLNIKSFFKFFSV